MPVSHPIEVRDPGDPRLDDYRNLTDAELRRRVEAAGEGLFIAEGMTVIERVLSSPYRLRSVLVNPSKLARLAQRGIEVDCPVYVAPTELLSAVAGFSVHRGALAAAHRRPPVPLAELLSGARLVVVLDGLTNSENVGSIARSAASLGVDAMVLSPNCVDPLYRRAVRVSMGEVLRLPWRVAEHWPGELAELAGAGFTVVGLDPGATASVDDLVDRRVALVLGEEGPGLSESVRSVLDHTASIPMRPGADSLNVAVAAAIAFHRLGRW